MNLTDKEKFALEIMDIYKSFYPSRNWGERLTPKEWILVNLQLFRNIFGFENIKIVKILNLKKYIQKPLLIKELEIFNICVAVYPTMIVYIKEIDAGNYLTLTVEGSKNRD